MLQMHRIRTVMLGRLMSRAIRLLLVTHKHIASFRSRRAHPDYDISTLQLVYVSERPRMLGPSLSQKQDFIIIIDMHACMCDEMAHGAGSALGFDGGADDTLLQLSRCSDS